MSCFDNDMSRLLGKSAEFIGKGTLCGALYDLGAYPGVFYDSKSKNVIHGEIYELNNANETELLRILDAYEGITGDKTDEYYRTKHPVQADGSVLNCWVYVLKRIPNCALFIKTGKYATDTLSLKANNKNCVTNSNK